MREMGTERERRQTIGRGLRLCVNQNGERLRGFDVNTLTVIATESYEQFAENLQKEIEEDTGIRFGIVEKHQFAAIPVTDAAGKTTALGVAQSEAIWTHLKDAGNVDANGKVQDTSEEGDQGRHLQLPELTAHLPRSRKCCANSPANWKSRMPTSEDDQNPSGGAAQRGFKALWNRIKHKTTYRVQFDNEKLVEGLRRGPHGMPADHQDALAMAQSRPCHRQGRR